MSIAAGAALLASALAGCDQIAKFLPAAGEGGNGGPSVFQDQRIDDVPTAEPGMDRGQWRAASARARNVTGNLTVSSPQGRSGPLFLAFGNGVTYELQQLGVQDGSDSTGDGRPSFAQALGADPRTLVYVYRVLNERVDSVAPEGGLCGEDVRATFLAITEYVTSQGDWALMIASFKGATAPNPSGGDPEHCAAFVYGLS